eukprot:3211543-Prorocentrum_lima.AAC.1
MEEKYDTYQEDPSSEKLDILEAAEEVLIGTKGYQTCSEYGELQEEYLKALDIMDVLTENLMFYH